jgi:hypothetical protein
MLFDEFDAETSPEFTQLFAEIAGELNYRRKLAMEENDKFLRDFRAAWGGLKNQDGSVLDNGPSPEYVARHYAINGPESNYKGQQKDVESITAGGVVISPSPDGGLVFRQGAGGGIVVTADGVDDFFAGCYQVRSQRAPTAPSPTNMTSAPVRHGQNDKLTYGNPVLQERMERNEREMKKYAEQSGTKYPRWS